MPMGQAVGAAAPQDMAKLQMQVRRMRHHGEMPPIHVKKEKVIESLLAFKEKHIEAYSQAIDNYRRKAIGALRDVLGKLEADNEAPELSFALPKPMSYEFEYDSHIKMWEMHEGDVIVLTGELYRLYFEDEWGWREQFDMLNSTYLGA